MHALLWVQRLFPHYKNFIFLAVGEVDTQSYEGQQHLRRLRETIETSLRYYSQARSARGVLRGLWYRSRGGVHQACRKNHGANPVSVCFASQLIFSRTNFLTAWLHNQTPLFIQRRLHLKGTQMVLLPMRVG
jgi:hypothetical protein